MDNITVIVEDYPQEITVQVTTTGITVDQANQIVTNTQKVSDINHVTLELFNVDNTSDANKPISDATNQVLNTETQARIDADNVLQSNIDSEAATRLANDNTIQGNLSTESSTRLANDNTLQSNINNLDTRVALNDVKVGITPTQSSNIVTNNAKVGITTSQTNEIIANNAKVGYTDALVSANTSVVANTNKVGITVPQSSDIVTNNSKVGYTDALVSANSDVIANKAKVGITNAQASDITANNAKVSDINHVSIELPNVSNTSDVNKPISIATQSALDLKVDKTENELNTENIFKSVSFTMDYSDRVRDDSGTVESRECVMNEYLKIIK